MRNSISCFLVLSVVVVVQAPYAWGGALDLAIRDLHVSGPEFDVNNAVRDRHASGQSSSSFMDAVRNPHVTGGALDLAIRDRHEAKTQVEQATYSQPTLNLNEE